MAGVVAPDKALQLLTVNSRRVVDDRGAVGAVMQARPGGPQSGVDLVEP